MDTSLQEAERLRELVDDLQDFIENGALSLHWVDEQGTILWANKAELDLLGFARDEYVGQNIRRFHADPDTIDDVLRRLGRNETLEDYSATLRAKDGSIKHVLITSNVRRKGDRFVHTRCFTRDVTALRQAELLLRESERRRRLAMAAARIGTWEYDVATGRVVWTGVEPIHGLPEGSFGGNFESYLEDVHPDDRDYVLASISGAIRSGNPLDMEYRITLPDGRIRWVKGEGQVERDAEGRPVRMFGICMDISTQRLALEGERQARHAAEEANRLKDEFLATVSHELRTPLNAILGWAQMLLQGQLKPERVSHALATISANAKRQQRLVEDLLDVSRVISGRVRLEIGEVDVEAMARSALEVTAPAAEAKGIAVGLNVAPDLGAVLGDANRLQQVVWNLVSNAIKFTPRDGRVDVDIAANESELTITVRDTGIGISPDFLPFVFAPFRQADATYTRTHTGLGLGLAIVKHLVELHGGTIAASSEGDGRGATFVATIPRRRVAADRPIAVARPDQTSSLSEPLALPDLTGLCVLVVDDDADARELAAEYLGVCGARALRAASAAEADALLAANTPDVMLVDLAMPGEDGCAFYERFKRRRPDQDRVAAVALTAHATARDLERTRRAGFAMHLHKPVELAEIAAVVASLTQAGRPREPVEPQ